MNICVWKVTSSGPVRTSFSIRAEFVANHVALMACSNWGKGHSFLQHKPMDSK